MSANKVILIGNLGQDPEIKQFDNGMIATLSIATSERWTDKTTGERREQTEWHRVVLNNRTAEIAEKHLKKGAKVYIEGSIRTRKWTDKNTGQERYSTEVRGDHMQILDTREDSPQSTSYNRTTAPQGYVTQPTQPASDDIPF